MADYNAYLVRIWHATERQRFRIVVQDAYSDRQIVFTDSACFTDFINSGSISSQEETAQKLRKEIYRERPNS